MGSRPSSLLNQDAKNNQAQLPRAPAQPAPACLSWRPFSWVLEANCFVSSSLYCGLPRGWSGDGIVCLTPETEERFPQGLPALPAIGAMGPCLNPSTHSLFSLGAIPCWAGHPTPRCLGPSLELLEFFLGYLDSKGGKEAVPLTLRVTLSPVPCPTQM